MSDEEIIARYPRRDASAIRMTSDRYSLYCREIAQRILGSPEDAGECVNDTWWTADGGSTWEKLREEIPADYEEYHFTPLSPTFDGAEGVYPILANGPGGVEETV